MQEHWLHTFELPKVQEELDRINLVSAFKTYDEDRPIPHTNKKRGQASIGLIWNRWDASSIEILPDGGNRIIAANISLSNKQVLLIGVYFPYAGYKSSLCDYQNALLELEEILA